MLCDACKKEVHRVRRVNGAWVCETCSGKRIRVRGVRKIIGKPIVMSKAEHRKQSQRLAGMMFDPKKKG